MDEVRIETHRMGKVLQRYAFFGFDAAAFVPAIIIRLQTRSSMRWYGDLLWMREGKGA